jgi:DNA-binding CsgD family transcriptional regulator/tetratricopeptide (TPR) repeat protein
VHFAPYASRMLMGRPGLSPVMVGRAAELDRLARLIDEGSTPAIALVGGEAGVGKTRLVRELIDRLPIQTRILAGQADPGTLGRPFEVVLDAIGAAKPGHEERVGVIADRNRSTDERVAAGLEEFACLTQGGPSVVIFDDLHWSDSESVLLFERLAEPGAGPGLLIGTYRPDALSRRHPVADLLPRLERRHAVTHLHLGRLGVDDVGSFLSAVYGRPPSYRVIEALHARTGGNPFFLEELLAAAGEADPDHLMSQPLPWSLGELVRAQLDELSADERCVVETAAVLGRRVSFDLLATVSGFGEVDLIRILRSLVAKGLLVETESDLFSFRHALAREAIEADLLGRERRRLHQAALDALRAASSDDVASIAHHAHGAGRLDEMVIAAKEGATHYLGEGSTHQALQLAELGLTEAPDDLELLSLAARAAWLAGLVDDAVPFAERRLTVARARGNLQAESSSLRRLMRLRYEQSDMAAMDNVTNQLIALVDRLPPGPEQGNAMAGIAQSFMLRNQYAEAVEWADRAIALGETIGDDIVRVWGQAEKGSAFVYVPELSATGVALLESAADEAERLGEWVIAARALHNRIYAIDRPSPDQTRFLLTRMRDAGKRAGFDSMAGISYWLGQAELAEMEGDIDAALAYIDEGRRRDRATLGGNKASFFRVHEAGLALEIGNLDTAEEVVRAFVEIAPAGQSTQRPTWWLGLAAHVACRRGNLEQARRALRALAAAAPSHDPDALVHDVLSAALRVGVPVDEARALVEGPLLPAALRSDDHPWWSLLVAQIDEAEQRHEPAMAGYLRAADRGERVLWTAVRGTALVGAARCAIALGRIDDAERFAERAAQLLARWRGWRVDDLVAVQRRLGRAAVLEGPAVLTPREREVVSLLAEGLTNAELAARLFISPKTAAVHVSNILAKLGMSSRTEIATFAVREGLVSR